MYCKYCDTEMMSQGTDRIMGKYITLYACLNSKCKAVYEEYRDLKGNSLHSYDRWWNPITKEFEK